MNFDKYCSIYPSWVVLGSKIVMRSSPGGGTPGMTWIEKTENNLVPNYQNSATVLEQKLRGVESNLLYSNTNDSLGKGYTWKNYYSAKKWFKSNPYGQEGLVGNSAQDCADQVTYNCCFMSADGRDPSQCNFIVQIDYIVAFRHKTKEVVPN